MSNKGDYGYFGKGSSGYAHYMQAFNESSHSSSGGSGRNNNNNNDSSADGCLIYVLGGFLLSIVVLASDGLEEGGMIFIYLLLIIICLGTIFLADNVGSSVKVSQNQKSPSTMSESTSSTKVRSQKYINIRNNVIALLAIIVFFGSIITAFYTLRTEGETVESEILSLASSGHYQQAFDLIENYYSDRSEREILEEKVKSMMPEKERVKMFPEDYIRFTLVLNLKEQMVNGKREEAYEFVDLIYKNNSQYDVKIFNIDSYYINEYSTRIQRNIEYETVLKRDTHQGHDEYYDERPYFNDNYIIWNTTRFNVSKFDVEVLD